MTEAYLPTTHRTLAGDWAVCPSPAACKLLFHFPAMTPEAMLTVPETVLWAMCETVDPPDPTLTIPGYVKIWADAAGEAHRDYDLPAAIMPGGAQWLQHGVYHRAHGRPAMTWLDKGNADWYEAGVYHRDGGLPARIQSTYVEWWEHGTLLLRADKTPGQALGSLEQRWLGEA